MYQKNKQYKSEITEFINNLKASNPELEKNQKFGRSILWDKRGSPDSLSAIIFKSPIESWDLLIFLFEGVVFLLGTAI